MTGRISVIGRGAVAARPDRLELSIEVTALESAPDRALDVVAERSSALDRILEAAGVPEPSRTTSGLSVGEEHSWEEERQVFRGYRASNRFIVRLTDPLELPGILREATQQAKARIQGPWWRVDPDNDSLLEACRRAASDARRKAEAYAESLGLRVGQIVRVKEPRIHEPLSFGYMPLSSRGQEEAQLGLEIHPGAMDVTAAVDVTFQLEEI
jgi:uncharacterized protein YggE